MGVRGLTFDDLYDAVSAANFALEVYLKFEDHKSQFHYLRCVDYEGLTTYSPRIYLVHRHVSEVETSTKIVQNLYDTLKWMLETGVSTNWNFQLRCRPIKIAALDEGYDPRVARWCGVEDEKFVVSCLLE